MLYIDVYKSILLVCVSGTIENMNGVISKFFNKRQGDSDLFQNKDWSVKFGLLNFIHIFFLYEQTDRSVRHKSHLLVPHLYRDAYDFTLHFRW